jgi:Fe-S cluster biogenesis protein NfuA
MNDEIKAKVRQIIDEKVRPNLQGDGGDIELVDITDEGVVQVRLTGSCSGCPFSAMTLAFGVEKVLKESIPEVSKIQPVP